MVDESKTEVDTKPQEFITMVIKLDPATNKVEVSGPIQDKVLAYGMLEYAKDAIRSHHEALQSKLVKSNGHGILNFARRK